MKRNFLVVLIFSPLLVSLTLWLHPGRVFYVVFNNKPILKDSKVYASGYPIGVILQEELTKDLKVLMTIKIYQKYVDAITKDSVFYVDKGKLTYGSLVGLNDIIKDKQKLSPLPPKSVILGFCNKQEFYLFKAKYILTILSKKAEEEAQRIYKSIITDSNNNI